MALGIRETQPYLRREAVQDSLGHLKRAREIIPDPKTAHVAHYLGDGILTMWSSSLETPDEL